MEISQVSSKLTELDVLNFSKRINSFESTEEKNEIENIISKSEGTPEYVKWQSVQERTKTNFKSTERIKWKDNDIMLFFVFAIIYGGTILKLRLSNLNRDKISLILYHCCKPVNEILFTVPYSSIREKFLRHALNSTLMKLWHLAREMVQIMALSKSSPIDMITVTNYMEKLNIQPQNTEHDPIQGGQNTATTSPNGVEGGEVANDPESDFVPAEELNVAQKTEKNQPISLESKAIKDSYKTTLTNLIAENPSAYAISDQIFNENKQQASKSASFSWDLQQDGFPVGFTLVYIFSKIIYYGLGLDDDGNIPSIPSDLCRLLLIDERLHDADGYFTKFKVLPKNITERFKKGKKTRDIGYKKNKQYWLIAKSFISEIKPNRVSTLCLKSFMDKEILSAEPQSAISDNTKSNVEAHFSLQPASDRIDDVIDENPVATDIDTSQMPVAVIETSDFASIPAPNTPIVDNLRFNCVKTTSSNFELEKNLRPSSTEAEIVTESETTVQVKGVNPSHEETDHSEFLVAAKHRGSPDTDRMKETKRLRIDKEVCSNFLLRF